MTFEEYLAGLAPVQAAPTLEDTEEYGEIRATAAAISALPQVDKAALIAMVSAEPRVVLRTLGLAVGLSHERLTSIIRHHFGTTGLVGLGKSRPDEVVQMLDDEYGLVARLESDRQKDFNFGDLLVARAGTRRNAAAFQAGGRGIEDAVEEVAKELGLPYELRTRFVGRGGRDAPCDLAIPAGQAEAQIVCAAKGFDSTGSKLSDAVREVLEMADVRRPNQYVYAVVDGIAWHRRAADLRRIFALWESNEINGLYTIAGLPQFKTDLEDAAKRSGLL